MAARYQERAVQVPSLPRRLRDPVLPVGDLSPHRSSPQGIYMFFWKRDEGSGFSAVYYNCCFAEIHLGPC